ncbi:MAG TPA: bifunctional 2-polyprenyl-6-hydroxyphenol methylase/3-demethylubiquinol 3-O-methyltransferase UbiG [Gammaproteobacteria bacterium]
MNESTTDAAGAAPRSVDRAELEKFAARAGGWWDPSGPFKTLHDINPLRVGYIAERAALNGARVLDVGCGGGILAEALARRGARVVGIDLAAPGLEAAREHAAAQGLAIEYVCASAAEIAAREPGAFDVVTCLELLEHVPNADEVVAACARALRPGGAAFFSTINRNLKSFLLAIVGAEYLLGMVPRGTHEYAKLIRPSELARACRAAGLAVRDLTGLHYNPLTRSYALGGNVDVNYLAHAVKPEAA